MTEPILAETPWITPAMAAKASGRRVQTIRAWMYAGRVSGLCLWPSRMTVVYWPDVYDETFDAPRRRSKLLPGRA